MEKNNSKETEAGNLNPDHIVLAYSNNLRVAKACQPVYFGRAQELNYDSVSNTSLSKKRSSVSEQTFYYIFCTINNITEDDSIADTQLLVLSALMARPLDFTLPKDSKDGKLSQIAKELSTPEKQRSSSSIYQSVKRLRDKGYLVETENKLIVPAAKFQYVRRVVKKQIEENGYATFDYLFKCFIE